jgi:putative thioredoxin
MESQVFAVAPESFQTDVIERSQQSPIVLLFWAEQVPPSAETKQQLETLVAQYQGKVFLGLVDVAEDQTLAQQLRVQGLPAIRVIKGGQLVEQIDGPQPEATLRNMLDTLTLSSGALLKERLALSLEQGDYDGALEILQRSIDEEPNNPSFRVELADVLVLKGDLQGARTALATVAEDVDELDRPQARLQFAEEAIALPSVDELARVHETEPDNLDICYQLAVREVVLGHYQAALELAMTILRTDREFRDDVGRTTMIRIFAVLGKGSDLASRYRRQMFNYMH